MEWPASLTPASLTSTPETVTAYAELTADFNPIHLDPSFAATTPFGRPIVHGTWSLNALGLAMAATFPPEVAARADLDLQFVAPVFVGETIQAGGELRGEGTGKYYVWIKAGDRLVVRGTLRLGAATEVSSDPPEP
jgi:3-hydroxybutyryl-CoA dehydratase